jgi:hypothetical protein
VNQIKDSIVIALQAIWANKLRSFMTVLGNIVAVTSIVTVVTLIQGMNAMVSEAIVSDVGADAFTVQRRPPIRSEEDEERTRNNPLLTMDEAHAIRAFSPAVKAVMAQASRGATVGYREQELDGISIQGVTSDYSDFGTFSAERGRMMSSIEVDRSQPVTLIGYDLADKLFGEVNPLEKTIKIAGIPFRVVGVSEKKGSVFGNSQDNFAVIPLGAYQKLFGGRQSLTLSVKPVSVERLAEAMDDATVALRVSRHLKPGDRDNFGMFTSDTILNLYHQRCVRRAHRHRRVVARRRRHRHHEHHADGRDRADARDRTAQGPGRQAQRHHGAGAHRVDHALDVGRPDRDSARVPGRRRNLSAHAAPGAAGAMVGRARHRHHCQRRSVLRRVSRIARRLARSHRGAPP